MSILFWKFAGCKNCIRLVDYTLKQGLNINKWRKTMFYPRSGLRVWSHSDPSSASQSNYNHDASSYDFRRDRMAFEEGRRPMRRPDYPSERAFPAAEPLKVTCGELRSSDVGTVVRMKGRIQYKRLERFIQLRDSEGTTQLVVVEERLDIMKRIRHIPIDSHIEIVGLVKRRPGNTINYSMKTGEIEVYLEDILDVSVPKRKHVEFGGEDSSGQNGKRPRSSILLTSAEVARCVTPAIKQKFLQRTHSCGELSELYVNSEVTLCGWIERRRSEKFSDLKDGYGVAQLVVNTQDSAVCNVMQSVKPEDLVVVKGIVNLRPSHQRNTRMSTGDIEVKVSKIEVVDPDEVDPIEVETASETAAVTEATETQQSLSSSQPSHGDVNSYTTRTHTCGQLRGGDVGTEVTLCGWLDSHRGGRFGTLRDGHGKTQILIPSELESSLGKKMEQTPLESVVRVVGTVCARPPSQVKKTQDTGEIELVVKEFVLLNPAKKDLPFVIRDHNKPKEAVRMKYRYLDLRFADMQHRMRLRSRVLMKMREFLVNQRGFVEVETPTLFRRTPGGAQEYVVPTRQQGKFYSLVQSPQQLKQLLMVGALDRYFQVARCYRDEGARPDRQPEFTQMDIELSFTSRDDIMTLITDLIQASWPEDLQPLRTPFPVLKYRDAMHLYGSDKPDLSFDTKLFEITHLISEERKGSLPENLQDVKHFTAKALVFSQSQLQKLKSSLEECEKQLEEKGRGQAKLIKVKCSAKDCDQELTKALPFVNVPELKETLSLQPPASVVVGIGNENVVLPLLGKLRQEVLSSPTSDFHFAWIVDFPLFMEGDEGALESTHHPFTAPVEGDLQLLDSDPTKVRGLHFDLVLNGYEIGGGSVRIHDAELQTKVLRDILKIPTDSLDHLLEALRSGAPPHGGIALGMDRLLAVMTGADSIRDVIAFPKGSDGRDPLSGAPSDISDEERRMYHLAPKQ